MDQVLLVISNVPDATVAQHIAEQILAKKLAACVNVMPEMRSFYTWNGRQETATEIPLLIKSTQARYADLQALILSLHPYEVPEIIAIPVADGLPAYLQWVIEETGRE
ncbi:MAG: divalent-cation tolerance protein CutA [Pseudomonadota bacterium]